MTSKTEGRWTRWVLWVSGLLVALGAGATTAHGLFEVAVAADVPAGIAWLYPVITDGLALVAYVSTARLTDGGRSYAWAVVVLAAGLSGLAQAAYLAGGVADATMPVRFGIGAWPAIAAAIVAHLLFLLGSDHRAVQPESSEDPASVQPELSNSPVQTGVHTRPTVHAEAVQPDRSAKPESRRERDRSTGSGSAAPARERARSAARRYAAHHSQLPTTAALMKLADVSRGSAHNALKELREQPAHLHVVNDTDQEISQP